VLREIFGPWREEVRGGWRKLHNTEHGGHVERRELIEYCDEDT
jgi:hypothetical protein